MTNLDFDNYKAFSYTGVWYNGNTSISGTINAPTPNDNGFLIVMAVLGSKQTNTIQIWFGIYKGDIMIRFYNGTEWSSWETMYTYS